MVICVAVVVESVVAPVTLSVPPTVVLPVRVEAPLTLSDELSVVAPVAESVPPILALPVVESDERVVAPVTARVPELV